MLVPDSDCLKPEAHPLSLWVPISPRSSMKSKDVKEKGSTGQKLGVMR